jgi:DUF4097 and DUF4098 domain-containing protein YvlB
MNKEDRLKKVVFFALAAVLVISIGCYYSSDDASDSATETYPTDLYNRIEIETENGEITSGIGSDSITVTLTRWVNGPSARAHLDDIDVIVNKDTVNGILRIKIEMPNGTIRSYGCDADIKVPESLYVDLVTSNGSIKAEGHKAGLYLETSNKEIAIANTAGEAILRASNGAIDVNRHTGNIVAETSNGKVDAKVIMVKTVVDSTDTTYGYCRFTSSNGDITLAIPDSVGANIRLETSNGDITVDPDLHTQGDYNSEDDIYETKMGDESGEINLETSNGDVTLKKL